MNRSLAAKLTAVFVDTAVVLFVWGGAVLAEDVALGFLWRDQFSGPWEISQARHVVGPIAVALLAPLAAAVAVAWRWALRAGEGDRAARRAFAIAAGAAALLVALGVSEGRHFARLSVRAPFVLLIAAAGTAAGFWTIPWIASRERRPTTLAAVGLGVAIGGWMGDAYVLDRLYPAFHGAMVGACLLGAALAGLGARWSDQPGRGVLAFAVVMAFVAGACIADVPRAKQALEGAANLRIVLTDRAPLLGRAVVAAMAFGPDGAAGGDAAAENVAATEAAEKVAPGEVARSLDWSGHDLVLITVDALRADHVSSYGYPRPTTPNLDALAVEGARFDAAYCPTPHTSYSLTSMMTGKYLRPLLALRLGEDSETWAQDLRRYGWRTAAFYPPAVFFIDEDRFASFEAERLGFEYAKVEFADPVLRESQVTSYLAGVPAGLPLFLWVHFFEPHEPYVVHPEHVFTGGASTDVDAYDSEVATADEGIGRIVRAVAARRRGAVVIVTADHGEEFGEHGGRYHGTTVYDEQVRVPLVIVGPGVRPGQRIATVAQTIDLLPTALSALGIPRPARLRGRDLGAVLQGDAAARDEGRAFVEADDYELMASGQDRLICQRRAAACGLYRTKDDPLERRDVSLIDPKRFEEMRALLREVARDHGRYETTVASTWPEPLRRGVQGDVEAAPDVADLLDDAKVSIRRKAAEVCFALHASSTIPQLKRAIARDEDDEVRRWSALALARMGEPLPPMAVALLRDPNRDWRRSAALAMAERGDSRGCDEIASWWNEVTLSLQRNESGEPPRISLELVRARELLAATATGRCRTAVPALVRALDDVRARPFVADALGALGDDRARGPLLAALDREPYVTARPREARALLALGFRDAASTGAAGDPAMSVTVPRGAARILVLLSDAHADVTISAAGAPGLFTSPGASSSEHQEPGQKPAPNEKPNAELEEVRAIEFDPGLAERHGEGGASPTHPARPRVRLELRASSGGIVGVWILPRPS